MNTNSILLVFQIVSAIALTLAILVQSKGSGLGKAWGSGSTSFTRRGLEKILFKLTFLLAGIFILVSILQILV